MARHLGQAFGDYGSTGSVISKADKVLHGLQSLWTILPR